VWRTHHAEDKKKVGDWLTECAIDRVVCGWSSKGREAGCCVRVACLSELIVDEPPPCGGSRGGCLVRPTVNLHDDRAVATHRYIALWVGSWFRCPPHARPARSMVVALPPHLCADGRRVCDSGGGEKSRGRRVCTPTHGCVCTRVRVAPTPKRGKRRSVVPTRRLHPSHTRVVAHGRRRRRSRAERVRPPSFDFSRNFDLSRRTRRLLVSPEGC
jgi:hypothetical protein